MRTRPWLMSCAGLLLWCSLLFVGGGKMGRQPGAKKRHSATQDDIKSGKQTTLNLASIFPRSSAPQNIPIAATPDEPPQAVEVIDDDAIFVSNFPFGDFTSEKLGVLKNQLNRLIRFMLIDNRRNSSPPRKRSSSSIIVALIKQLSLSKRFKKLAGRRCSSRQT